MICKVLNSISANYKDCMRKTKRNLEIGDHINILLEDREESRKHVSKLLAAGPSSYVPNYSQQFGKQKYTNPPTLSVTGVLLLC